MLVMGCSLIAPLGDSDDIALHPLLFPVPWGDTPRPSGIDQDTWGYDITSLTWVGDRNTPLAHSPLKLASN